MEIEVTPQYLADQSSPDDGVYAFAYTVRITNGGTVPVQLISRHWLIDDAMGRREEVKGLGVVGTSRFCALGRSLSTRVAAPYPPKPVRCRAAFSSLRKTASALTHRLPSSRCAPRAHCTNGWTDAHGSAQGLLFFSAHGPPDKKHHDGSSREGFEIDDPHIPAV